MAPPSKRKNNGKPDTAAENNGTKTSTRSSARLASLGVTKSVGEAVPKTKKAKTVSKDKKKPETKAKTTESKAELAPVVEDKVGNVAKTVVIEHCKQCNQFKIRAVKVKDALEKAISGITVHVNPEKPRRGCFEVREEGGKTFISLLDMKRPFAPMKALDMDAVISDIIDQVK